MIYLVERAKVRYELDDGTNIYSTSWEPVGYTIFNEKAEKYLDPTYIHINEGFKYRYQIIQELP